MQTKFSNPEFKDFITGKLFDNNCQILFDISLKVRNRDLILKELTNQKKIIHIGCVDHLEIIEQKIKSGTWLHNILLESSERCLGIDINPEGISYLQQRHLIPDLVCADITQNTINEISQNQWDYILLPEVLEHISNPVSFLCSLKEKYGNNIDKIIITVPNVFALPEYIYASRNIELINSDHRYWFSPYTILKVINDAGLILEDMYLVNGFWGPFYYNFIQRVINRIFSLTANPRDYKKVIDIRFARSLLVIASFK
ncbi:MAG: hypothetical protein NTX61_06700 [Bacteroidetes bacterium]|nr:hypothetical protein [Bacteroidota bacterium]